MTLTLEQKIGQMLCFGWSGPSEKENVTFSAHARELINEMEVGGIILMGRNLASPYVTTAKTINEMQSSSKLPLFIGVDQEGGMVARFQEPMTVFPSNMAIGATRSADYARRAAEASAEELLAVGVNWDFAPVLDVNNNPMNPIIGMRSFGESPELVAEMGVAAIEGYRQAGVIASAKHFPGHGDTAVDSHLALPLVPYDLGRLNEVELKPFGAAISAGVDSIMTTHIIFTEIDPDYPATLSKKVITGLLRGEMGFNGVVITDCLEMDAIADNYGRAEAAVLAVEAGVDILLACHTLSIQRELREAVLKAVRAGRVEESRIDESVQRILALKRKHNLEQHRFTDPAEVINRLGTLEHRTLQREIAEKSITIVRDRDHLLPITVNENQEIVVTGLHRSFEHFSEAISSRHVNTTAILASAERVGDAVKAASRASVAIVATCPKEPWADAIDESAQADLVRQIFKSSVPTIVIAVRDPYDLRAFPEIGTYLATYGYRQASLDAVAGVIFGEIEAKGKLPVSVS